jgi:hypothetical protein
MRPLGALLALAVLAALASPCAAGAPSLDGAVGAVYSGAASGTATLTTTSGNDVIVVLASNENGSAQTVSSVTASGLTFTRRGGCAFTGSRDSNLEVWAAPASGVLSAKVITVTLSGATDDATIIAFGVHGAVSLASPWDAHSGLPACTSGSPPTASPTYSTTSADDFVFITTMSDGPSGNQITPGSAIAQAINSGGSAYDKAYSAYATSTSPQSGTVLAISNNGEGITLIDAIAGAPIGACSLASTGVGPC